jgi:hypothetical protein
MKKFALVSKMGKHFFATYRARSLNRNMTDVNFPIIQHYKDFWRENWGMISTSFTYTKDWEELTGVMENMMKLHCRSCDGWGHAAVDISKGKKGMFAGKKIQCPTQEVLDGVIALHVNWK